jgi:hypothetical protein
MKKMTVTYTIEDLWENQEPTGGVVAYQGTALVTDENPDKASLDILEEMAMDLIWTMVDEIFKGSRLAKIEISRFQASAPSEEV